MKDLMERIHYIQDTFDSPALIEEYIEGRRIYAAVLGNDKPEGRIFVIEANPNPWLSSGAEFMLAAKKSGRSYAETIQAIVDLALARYA